MVEEREFLTTETPLAAYLILEGFNLLHIDYDAPRANGKQKATFVFKDSPELQNLVNIYSRGDATANIARFEHAKSSLIDRIMRGLP